MQCIDGFSLLLQKYIRKEPERTQLNAVHAQLLEKLRLIASAETWRFLTIQLLEFQKIWQKKNSSEST